MASSATVDNTNDKIVVAVWLDSEININKENREAEQLLRTIINHLKTFENKDECEKYIRSVSSQERLLLIVSGRMGIELVPRIHALQQVTSIYVYCKDKERNEKWAKQFTQIKAVVTRLDELVSRIKTDQQNFLLVIDKETTSDCVVDEGVVESTRKVSIRTSYSQFLSSVLLLRKSNETDKHDLISFYKNNSKHSESELKIIREFEETYSSNKALWWYTRADSIRELLNNALQTADINTIFLFQFFIRDVLQQMTEYQCQDPIKVYAGVIKSQNEINNFKESVGRFISFPTFFSTLFDYDTLNKVIKGFKRSNDLCWVLFEIDADPKVVTIKPFAEISKHSDLPKRRKVLFAIGSFFRITSVEQNDDQVWVIRMTLCGDDDADLKPLLDEITKQYGPYDGEAALSSFSRVLREMKKFDEVETYCRRLIQDFSSNKFSLGMLHNELAEIKASRTGDHELSEQSHQKSIKVKEQTESGSCDNIPEASTHVADNVK